MNAAPAPATIPAAGPAATPAGPGPDQRAFHYPDAWGHAIQDAERACHAAALAATWERKGDTPLPAATEAQTLALFQAAIELAIRAGSLHIHLTAKAGFPANHRVCAFMASRATLTTPAAPRRDAASATAVQGDGVAGATPGDTDLAHRAEADGPRDEQSARPALPDEGGSFSA